MYHTLESMIDSNAMVEHSIKRHRLHLNLLQRKLAMARQMAQISHQHNNMSSWSRLMRVCKDIKKELREEARSLHWLLWHQGKTETKPQ